MEENNDDSDGKAKKYGSPGACNSWKCLSVVSSNTVLSKSESRFVVVVLLALLVQ